MVAITFLLISFLLSDFLFGKHVPNSGLLNLIGVAFSGLLIVFPHVPVLRRLVLLSGSGLLSFHLYVLMDFKQPFTELGGFSFVEYLTVFVTFIYGFVAWRFLEGWGVIIDRFKILNIGFDYLPWSILGFLLMLETWWSTWVREAYLPRNILYFLLALTVPILFYFLSAIMFPIELLKRGYLKLNYYYFRNIRTICVFFGLIMFSNLVVGNVMEETDFLSNNNLYRYFGIALATLGMLGSWPILHRSVLALGLILIIVQVIIG